MNRIRIDRRSISNPIFCTIGKWTFPPSILYSTYLLDGEE